jgi:hypothetical protein
MSENRRGKGAVEGWSGEAGFSATAAKCAASGRNDDFMVRSERTDNSNCKDKSEMRGFFLFGTLRGRMITVFCGVGR